MTKQNNPHVSICTRDHFETNVLAPHVRSVPGAERAAMKPALESRFESIVDRLSETRTDSNLAKWYSVMQ